ncbi:MAG: hypothetical protein V2I46_13775 [Bacteroides sp.]|jgi:hypothetical protein|nr:hypothetical protein [Bacteroides sp.]
MGSKRINPHLSLVLVIFFASLLVFSSCIFGRKSRKCDCPTWSYELPTGEEPAPGDAASV